MSMSKIFQTTALVAALISSVAGHTSVEKFEAGGKTYEGYRQASKVDPGNQSPAWWTAQGWGYQPFFKIHESALIDYRKGRYSSGSPQEQTGYWGTDAIFYDNRNTQTVKIPSDIPSQNYVLRTEVVSIHNNGDVSNRQFWPQAFNIKVTGGKNGAKVPAGKKGTELYKANDPLLKWDLYWHKAGQTSPDAPGPQIASVASSNSRRHARDFSS
ncbi:hypothetical protein GGP41_007531 [Bipolaris sorokiniana]|uniref:Auxiliary Activity family 9 catalytic domain-containing protein n=1 Tax=Cochliobolus sativus TaxID=45130 RepID=A0A8H6DQQ6_COCSA|nr:hypothetical protein GGP41_007531 [Bipolaris sorokiniana]